MFRARRRDPLEWRGDRMARHDLWLMFDGDLDRAHVALATYEAQERRPKPETGRIGRDDREAGR